MDVRNVYILQEPKILMDDEIFRHNNFTFPTREISVPLDHRLFFINLFLKSKVRFSRKCGDLRSNK